MDRNEQCDNFSVCGNKHIIILPGYYHGTRLCEPCLEKRQTSCSKCMQIIGYVSCGSTLDKNYRIHQNIFCDECIRDMKKKSFDSSNN